MGLMAERLQAHQLCLASVVCSCQSHGLLAADEGV